MTEVALFLFWVALLALVMAGFARARARLRGEDRSHPLDDDDVRRIVDTGVLRTDEDAPLDLGEIESEERRFWQEEGWDGAEEW